MQPLQASEWPPVRCRWCPCGTAGCPMPRGTGVQGSSGHTSEEEQPCLSHAGAARASTCLVTGKSQPRSALPSVKWILAAPPLKQSRRSGAMAGALSHGSPAPGSPCESARPGAPARRTAAQHRGVSLLRCLGSRGDGAAAEFRLPAWAGGCDCDISPACPGSAATSVARMRRSRCGSFQRKPWSPDGCIPSLLSPLSVPVCASWPKCGSSCGALSHPHPCAPPQDPRSASKGALQPRQLCAIITTGVTWGLEGVMSLDRDCGVIAGVDLWSLSLARCLSPAPAA